MGELYKVKKSRDEWKKKAIQRGQIERDYRKELRRIKENNKVLLTENKELKKENKNLKEESESRQQHGERPSVVSSKIDLFF